LRELRGTVLENKIERSVYNKRKRKLFVFLEEIRLKMTEIFNQANIELETPKRKN